MNYVRVTQVGACGTGPVGPDRQCSSSYGAGRYRNHIRNGFRFIGLVVAGAEVSIVNTQTAAKLVAKTGADGRFVFTPLPIGTYRVVVEAGGFKKATVESVHLNIQQQAFVNVVQPGAVTENVEVTEAPSSCRLKAVP